jgi:hypothetical protein
MTGPSPRNRRDYFFLPDPNDGCQPAVAPFWLGAAAIILTFSFFGFFDSRLLLAMRAPQVTGKAQQHRISPDHAAKQAPCSSLKLRRSETNSHSYLVTD